MFILCCETCHLGIVFVSSFSIITERLRLLTSNSFSNYARGTYKHNAKMASFTAKYKHTFETDFW
jgi:hypothetical protein